ncbi:formylglycine-generating enzyme family protein [Aquabacterium sp. A7-Y]|uniref:formylglycine-generating enzyme family protein n=1 Tax=Aquabacterium sp. A7-Y TaxID=1349605 RepID=UPI00223CA0F2|nr:SUMF1/EgtB/PvdO family nonheme iron enzyme [Aquabacterium sp. A7-Y]MCW7538461.1 formylglycine-generating enzyme family protein [Aquabacterium sp. A7-Y]
MDALKAKARRHLVFVEGGTFQMGDFGEIHHADKLPYSASSDDGPLHTVSLTSYSLSAFQTTYADFDVYTLATGKPKIAMGKRDTYRRPDAPAGVSWQEARGYCRWLGTQLGLPMDLPTEAQWEYAARNRGAMQVYPTDNGEIDDGRNVPSYEQLKELARKDQLLTSSGPMTGGLYPPNPLGLHDLIANGYEWTLDWYDAGYYKNSPRQNPSGPAQGTEKVLRSYSNVSGETLAMVSMSFTRQHRPPRPRADPHQDGAAEGVNENRHTTVRCASNDPRPLQP